jgi:hypothetical protein
MAFGIGSPQLLVMGPCSLYTGAVGVGEPADTAVNVAPAASAWTYAGDTSGGLTIEIDQTYTELDSDQIVDSAGRRLTKREATITTQLADVTLANLSLALNGGTIASGGTPPGSGYQSYEPNFAASATQPGYIALLVDGWSPNGNGYNRRFLGRKALSTAKVTYAMKKDGQSFWTVAFNLHYVSSTVSPFHWVDQQ